MPEKTEAKVLRGETSITPSSDEHVRGLYATSRNQVYGVGKTADGEVIEGEIFAPTPVIPESDDQAPIAPTRPMSIVKLAPDNAALALSIFKGRQRERRRKAA